MQSTYVNTTTTSTTPATVIDAEARNIIVRKIVVGNPVSAGNITIFTEGNALSNNTTQIGMKITYPTFSTTNINGGPEVLDFRAISATGGSTEQDGLNCAGGGSIAIDQTMQVTVFWDYAQG